MANKNTCAECGTTTYRYADMVGDLCPLCAQERTLAAEVDAANAAFEQSKEQLQARRDEREEDQKRAADASSSKSKVKASA